MHSEPTFLSLDAAAARRLLLVRAIDEVDTQGKLLSAVERDQLERDAMEASRGPSGEPAAPAYLAERTRRVLEAVENRQPQLAAAQEPQAWRRWILWALPLAACILGVALDRIDNPERVNMLSPPLLGVLFWNLAAYLLLLVAALRQRRPASPMVQTLQRWLAGVPADGRRTGRLRPDVLARFHLHWLQATGTRQALWGKTLLHLTAAGWAAGLALAIVVGGLVRQYRVGWESTLLDLGQVHAFLRLLFAPVVALLPFDGFSAADLQRMAFSSGADIGVDEARRWVWLYLALLCLVVVVPRLLLAGWSAWRSRRQGQAVRIALDDPYFAEVLARIRPARITLGMLAPDAQRGLSLQRMLWQLAEQPPPRAGGPWTVLATDKGDTLCMVEVDGAAAPRAELPAGPMPAPGWLQGLWDRRPGVGVGGPLPAPAQSPLADIDLVLWLPSQPADIDACPPVLRTAGKPLLVLAPELLPYEDRLPGSGLDAAVVRLDDVTAHWLKDAGLLQAVAARLPQRQQAGLQRLQQAWMQRNERRFDQAMQLLAGLLAQAARESEEVAAAPTGLRQLVDPSQRDAAQRAREAAAGVVLERMREREAGMVAELVRLHRLDLPPQLAASRHQDPFMPQRSVDTRQAGVAGAGSGAAMGAGIDLMVGGLTLGAAAALGALIGGGAAYAAAAWRNRATASGRAQLQLSDAMLQSLVENALLAYLAVAHRTARPGGDLPPVWRDAVKSAVSARSEALAGVWGQARNALAEEAMARLLANELAGIARGLLLRL